MKIRGKGSERKGRKEEKGRRKKKERVRNEDKKEREGKVKGRNRHGQDFLFCRRVIRHCNNFPAL